MKEILFVTANEEKCNWARKKLAKYGISVLQKKLEISEPREFDIEKVAVEKAKAAMKYVQKPFIVDDTGFQISCLKSFPGTYLKLIMKTIGVEGLCKLAKGEQDRVTNFKSVLVYVDENRELHTFVCNDCGTIPEEPKGDVRKEWGDIMKIHIPDGFSRTLAEMNDSEFKEYEEKIEQKEHYVQLGEWLSRRDAK